jgi:dephospho-CoA kinase
VIKIVVTGGYGSGKSTVIKILSQKLNCPIFNADYIANVELKNNKKVKKIFNTYNRKIIGDIVFNDKNKLKELENIIHPVVKEQLDLFFIKNNKEKWTISEIPLLFEAQMNNLFDIIILVISDKNIRKKRTNNINFNKIIKNQLSDNNKIKNRDIIIKNNCSLMFLNEKINKLSF